MKNLVLICLTLICGYSYGQDDLMNMLDQEKPKSKEYVYATFKGTRIINFHTIESVGRRGLDFRIAHRFGTFNQGINNFWGLDGGANIKLSLEYSYDGRLLFGLGRSSYQKLLDGFIKYRLLRQTIGKGMPVSVTYLGIANYNTTKVKGNPIQELRFSNNLNRMSFVNQLIIGRKFNERISLQVSPTHIHYNIVDLIGDKNDMFAVGVGGRVKITKRTALTFEYGINNLFKNTQTQYYNSFAAGVDIETGGHVFQMHVVNSFGLNEAQFLPYTQDRWLKAGIRLGFNISRVFTI